MTILNSTMWFYRTLAAGLKGRPQLVNHFALDNAQRGIRSFALSTHDSVLVESSLSTLEVVKRTMRKM